MAAEQGSRPEPPDPFDETNPEAFLGWLNQPDDDGPPQLSRYLCSIYMIGSICRFSFRTSTAATRRGLPSGSGVTAISARRLRWSFCRSQERGCILAIPLTSCDCVRRGRSCRCSWSGRLRHWAARVHASTLRGDGDVQQSAEGVLAGFRRIAQRGLFRLLRPYAFQQHQLQMHLIAALRQTTVALRRQQHVHDSLDMRVRELTRELLAAKKEVRRLEEDLASARDSRANSVSRSRAAHPDAPRAAVAGPAGSHPHGRSTRSVWRAARRERACTGS